MSEAIKLFRRLNERGRLVNFNVFPGPDATTETLVTEINKALDQTDPVTKADRNSDDE